MTDPARPDASRPGSTEDAAYAARLRRLQGAAWKRLVPVQAPYRWNLRRLRLGYTLDVGCGIGRNLANLGGHAVGVDHNPTSVATCRARGFRAHTTAEFAATDDARPGSFDALLFAHVLEHLPERQARQLVRAYLPYLRAGGQVVLIAPQERGFAADPTHVEFLDFDALARLATAADLTVERSYSFPFPRLAGRAFPYNEFVVVARRA